jgi:CelD/BcsL family acetyltransferase involved in cellulose biosynthesis
MSATEAERLQGGSPGRLQVERFSDESGFRALRDDWVALEERAASKNIFVTHAWQHTWWVEMGGGYELDLLAFRHDGRLVGVVPTFREIVDGRPVVRFGGGLEVTDYCGFIVEPGYELEIGLKFVRHLLETPGLALDFHYLREDGVTLRSLRAALGFLDLAFHEEVEDVSPRVIVEGDWEHHLARLSKKDRHELRRKRRRLELAGGWQVRETSPETLQDDLAVFFDLHRRSMRAKADFLTPEVQAFFEHIVSHLQERGWLSLRTMVFEERPVAAVLGFFYDRKLLLYNSGYDPEYNRLSVGFVLMSEEIRLAIEQDLSEVDFLRGNESYKYDLGAVDLPLRRLWAEA